MNIVISGLLLQEKMFTRLRFDIYDYYFSAINISHKYSYFNYV